jgi:transcriptional regulator with PAS, ATPase and Fis domain
MRARDTLTLSPTEAGPDESKGSVAPLLFLCAEGHHPFAPAARFSLQKLGEVNLGRGAVRSYEETPRAGQSRTLEVKVDDGSMSSNHARIFKLMNGFVIEDRGSKNGTRVNGEKITRHSLTDRDVVEVGRTFFIYRDSLLIGPEDPAIFETTAETSAAPGLATLLPALYRTYSQLATIARAALPILITGETGAGKEVLSKAVHLLSGRAGPFVAFNCGALPETLVEAELFGHRKGAFSDAKEDRPGLVRAAHGGTLFLDEMGELKPPAQAALLRVLEESEVRPIGATTAIKVDVQFVSATNRSLEKMVAAGSFRADLYHRLAGHIVPLVPLRERREDLGIIVGALLKRHAAKNAADLRINSSAWRKLLAYGFPGNARELDKALHAAIALAQGGEIGAEHLPNWVREEAPEAPESERGDNDPLRDDLVRHFREQKGNVSAVARVMGKARVQVQRWMKRFKIDPQDYSK